MTRLKKGKSSPPEKRRLTGGSMDAFVRPKTQTPGDVAAGNAQRHGEAALARPMTEVRGRGRQGLESERSRSLTGADARAKAETGKPGAAVSRGLALPSAAKLLRSSSADDSRRKTEASANSGSGEGGNKPHNLLHLHTEER